LAVATLAAGAIIAVLGIVVYRSSWVAAWLLVVNALADIACRIYEKWHLLPAILLVLAFQAARYLRSAGNNSRA
jgi:hypothetical protein